MAMTSAEKIRALRERMKAQGLTQRSVYLPHGETTPTQEEMTAFLAWKKAGQALQATTPDGLPGESVPAMPQSIPEPPTEAERKEAQRKQWAEEEHQERMREARKEGRRLARMADHSRETGYIDGLCTAAAFFIGKHRPDIAQHLLATFLIDRAKAEAALQADKRTHSMTLETLDRGSAWDKQPQTSHF
jgi:hypothetical protein